MNDQIVYVSTYAPRKCGIATFTQDLSMSVSKVSSFTSKIVALNDNGNNYNYPDEVLLQIRDKDIEKLTDFATGSINTTYQRIVRKMKKVLVISIFWHHFSA